MAIPRNAPAGCVQVVSQTSNGLSAGFTGFKLDSLSNDPGSMMPGVLTGRHIFRYRSYFEAE